MYRVVTTVNKTGLYTRDLKFAERVNLKYSHHTQHKKMVTSWSDECINYLDSSYISYCIDIENHDAIYLKYTHYLSIIPQ